MRLIIFFHSLSFLNVQSYIITHPGLQMHPALRILIKWREVMRKWIITKLTSERKARPCAP